MHQDKETSFVQRVFEAANILSVTVKISKEFNN